MVRIPKRFLVSARSSVAWSKFRAGIAVLAVESVRLPQVASREEKEGPTCG
jgi:hypothetical protein